MGPKISKKKRAQSGVFFALLALLSFALLSIIALLFASGFMAANNARVQNAANMASLAALEEFVRATPLPGNPAYTFRQRADRAVQQANDLLDRQPLLGGKPAETPGQLGMLRLEGEGIGGGELILGRWFPKRSDGVPNPCSGNSSACFQRIDPPAIGSTAQVPSPSIDAVKINLTTPHSFLAPFISVFGASGLTLSASALSAVAPRCTVLVVDSSASSFEQSHPWRGLPPTPIPGPPPMKSWNQPSSGAACTPGNSSCIFCPDALGNPVEIAVNASGPTPYIPIEYSCPRDRMLFAFQTAALGANPNQFTSVCRGGTGYAPLSTSPNFNEQRSLWCNLIFKNNTPRYNTVPVPGAEPSQLPEHYTPAFPAASAQNSPYGPVYVDRVNPPRPMSDFLMGFNAGLTMLKEQSSQTDRIAMTSFKGRVFYHYPSSGMTPDTGFLLQATDARRLGLNQHPNFVDLGWFSLFDDNQDFAGITPPPPSARAGSNVVAALNDAINLLSNPANCVGSAQKSIILASDGIMNCRFDQLTSDWECADDYEYYLNSEDYLLRTGFNPSQDGGKSILQRMKEGRITFSMFMAGKSDPHMLNRKINDEFLTFEKSRTYGFRGMPPGALNPICADSAFRYSDACSPYVSPATDPLMMADMRSEEVAAIGVPSICQQTDGSGTPMYQQCTGIGAAGEAGRARYAFDNQWQPGIYFRRPVGAFMELALQTGGQFCPFLGVPSAALASTYYTMPNGSVDADSTLTDAYRNTIVDQRLKYNPNYHTPGQIAGSCALLTLGLNPFALVAEENY